MEEHFSDLEIDIFAQKHESDDLQRSESLELGPLDVEVEKVRSFLLLFGVCTDLLDRPVDQVLCVPVNCTEVSAGHHLVVAWDASVALLLVLKELLPQELEQVRMRRCALSRTDLQRLVDPDDFLRARLEAVVIELLLLDAFALGLVQVLRRVETLLLELDRLALQGFDLFDLLLDLGALLGLQPGHVNIWVLANDALLVLQTALLE